MTKKLRKSYSKPVMWSYSIFQDFSHPDKLISRWSGPFTMVRVFRYFVIKLKLDDNNLFKVKRNHVQHYTRNMEILKVYESVILSEVWVSKRVELCHEIKLGIAWEATYGLASKVWVPNISISCYDVKSSVTWEQPMLCTQLRYGNLCAQLCMARLYRKGL